MASKTVLIDDIDGKSHAKETVTFSVDGVAYEIDVNAKNGDAFREALAPYVKAARKASKPKANGKPSDAAKIREWAAANDVVVPDRGRIPDAVKEEYRAATAGK